MKKRSIATAFLSLSGSVLLTAAAMANDSTSMIAAVSLDKKLGNKRAVTRKANARRRPK